MKRQAWTFPIILLFLIGNIFVWMDNVKASDVKQLHTPFSDVLNDHWARDEIMWLVQNGHMIGEQDLQFRPDTPITVGEAAMTIHSLHKDWKTSAKWSYAEKLSKRQQQALLILMERKWYQPVSDQISGANESVTPMQLKQWLQDIFQLQETQIHAILKELDDPTVSRAEFAVAIVQTLQKTGKLTNLPTVMLKDPVISTHFQPTTGRRMNLKKVSFDDHPIYLRSDENISFIRHIRVDNDFSRDNVYQYRLGDDGATVELTVRSFDNGDYFLFSQLNNPTDQAIRVDVLQKENEVQDYALFRFDRYPIKRNMNDLYHQDMTSYPTGVLRYIKKDGAVEERMVGQAYRSKELTLQYPEGGSSYMRELLKEEESLTFIKIGTTFMSVHILQSKGKDLVDQWYLNADQKLFKTDEHREQWMKETASYYKKRNAWYTSSGPFNKMVTTTEPLPDNGQGYGRNLLLVKEDRALQLFEQRGDRYFENIVLNAFVNLKNFRGEKTYWETEVTSTYLKNLYGITAPFIDTRFNEHIALFYYYGGQKFKLPNAIEPLRQYADLLVLQKEQGNVISVAPDAYYIPDYFPIIQNVKTHASMNHVLGGMNILLLAYQQFGDPSYVETASAIQKAIALQKDQWMRENGDIWYKISPEGEFIGNDYKHLTLEDLIRSYQLWSEIDSSYLPVIEELIASKSAYLSSERLGYTTKIKEGLKEMNKLNYLPEGEERTDAL